MSEYAARVYDLDGTLVRLAVDWATVRAEVASGLREQGLAVDEESLWALFEVAEAAGHRDVVERTIAAHERAGARASDRLPMADELAGLADAIPVGVCSLNCEAACHLALEVHDIAGPVRTVVGRDSVTGQKPDPEPLLTVIDTLEADPGQTLFIGDTDRDRLTAERAGVPFQHVTDRVP